MKKEIISFLESNRDEKYSSFSSKLIKDNLYIVGVRLPVLLDFAKNHIKDIDKILRVEDDNIFEIRMIKLFVISLLKDIETYKKYFDISIEMITNWSLCDSFIMHSKVIKKDREYFFSKARELIESEKEFHKRIGFIILLGFFIDDDYVDKVFEIISSCKTNGYYSEMALAWLISVLYIKYTQKAKEFLLNNKIDKSILKMSIRKIKDSYRVSETDKKWIKKIEV